MAATRCAFFCGELGRFAYCSFRIHAGGTIPTETQQLKPPDDNSIANESGNDKDNEGTSTFISGASGRFFSLAISWWQLLPFLGKGSRCIFLLLI
jgi:hypothetical protein